MKKQYVSNSQESTPMFKSPLLEPLSKVHFSVPLFIYIPVIGYFLYQAIAVQHNSISVFLSSLAGGLLLWTITEYVLHRFVFHFEPQSTWGQRLHFIFHGVHHDYPNDALRLVMPPSVSIPLAFGFYWLFKSLLPMNMVPAFFAAFVSGYLFYDISHYALHHLPMKNGFMKKMKQHHMRHHYQDSTKGYGVSSSLWDVLFRSDFDK
ncbi:sterol desaturase family protein [Xanthocytophaga agilis]|uniref:Sterol desaturase family protein n=1 Tax=Xanthocytophaga agilis TaxID=3048010 RepID=A0AAE3UF81_9BACT|nr:sterol desaturase family protein [Xanthocytophaga agilis]MDJ1500283.1 sterol desaturase family protein [Xanthocytophaga agilis]